MTKTKRHALLLELTKAFEIETQQELMQRLKEAGCDVTQATVSRDIRELSLTKVKIGPGRYRYAAFPEREEGLSARYERVFREGYLSMDTAQNILVIRTVPGMAMAVAAALDDLDFPEIVGSIAGDDTIMSAIRTKEEAEKLMERLRRMVEINA